MCSAKDVFIKLYCFVKTWIYLQELYQKELLGERIIEVRQGHVYVRSVGHITSLEDELVYNYYLWANRRDHRFANWHVMPGAGPMPTIMRWYGANISRREDCVVCSEGEIQLDTGDDLEQALKVF